MARYDAGGRRSRCKFCAKDATPINYKDVSALQKFASAQGKMYGRKRLGTCAHHQKQVKKAIKRARFLGLMRYVGR